MSFADKIRYELLRLEVLFSSNVGKDHLGYQFFWIRFTPKGLVSGAQQLREECCTELVWSVLGWYFTIIGPDC